MVDSNPPSDRELDLLHWVAESGPVSVGEAFEGFGGERDLARTTVQTMLERLRSKGCLDRKKIDGKYRYTSRVAARDVLRNAVQTFVEGTLSGSVAPFVAYLSEKEQVTPEELRELQAIVSRLKKSSS